MKAKTLVLLCCAYQACLSDCSSDTEDGHQDDGHWVVVVPLAEPHNHAEHLEDVERVDDLQEHQHQIGLHLHSNLVQAVHRGPVNILNYSSAHSYHGNITSCIWRKEQLT